MKKLIICLALLVAACGPEKEMPKVSVTVVEPVKPALSFECTVEAEKPFPDPPRDAKNGGPELGPFSNFVLAAKRSHFENHMNRRSCFCWVARAHGSADDRAKADKLCPTQVPKARTS